MNARRRDEAYEKLGAALTRLGEALEHDSSDDLIRDAAIQRFEFTVELFWKALKADMQARGKTVGVFPSDTLSSAYQAGWIEDEDAFRAMLADRNVTSHTYDEKLATQIAGRLGRYYERMRTAHEQHPHFR